MRAAITAIGTAVPQYKGSQMELAELAAELNQKEKKLIKTIHKASGIHFRYSILEDFCNKPGKFIFFPNDPNTEFPTTAERMVLYKNNALKLALSAIKDCLDRLINFDKQSITHLITVSCTGMYAPGIDIEIIQQLQLNSSISRTAINFMGCYGVFNGLKIADSICQANPDAKVLLVSVEICTIHFQKKNCIDNIVANAIFSDGAAAAIIQLKSNHCNHLSIEASYCDLLPKTSHEMAWSITDSGFDIVLSSYVPEIIQNGIAKFVGKLFRNYKNTDLSNINTFAIHPGGIKILHACEKALNIMKDKNKYSYAVLQNYGNMSSATILFVLKNIWDDLKSMSEQTILCLAFGPGLTIESLLLKANACLK